MFDPPIVRVFASLTSLVAVPILLVLAYRAWMKQTRANLPEWRNGLGLTSLVLVALSWLWYALGLADIGLASLGSRFLLLSSFAVFGAVLAALLAIGWRGRSRLHALAASLLMLLGYQFFGYTSFQVRLL
jgi:hypothetical protein